MLNWSIAPSEFWAMSNEEWWWLYEATRPRDLERDYAGSLTESALEDIDEWISERELP